MGTMRPVSGFCIQSEKNTHDNGQRAYHQQFVPGDIAFFFIQIILNRFFDLGNCAMIFLLYAFTMLTQAPFCQVVLYFTPLTV